MHFFAKSISTESQIGRNQQDIMVNVISSQNKTWFLLFECKVTILKVIVPLIGLSIKRS
jgi:hypothetical protein